MDTAIINVLNSMQRKVKEYEIENGIITVNEDESPYAKYENTATNLQTPKKQTSREISITGNASKKNRRYNTNSTGTRT